MTKFGAATTFGCKETKFRHNNKFSQFLNQKGRIFPTHISVLVVPLSTYESDKDIVALAENCGASLAETIFRNNSHLWRRRK